MSVSISDSHNVDLDAIIAGGAGFADRLQTLAATSKDARELKQLAERLLAEAKATQAEADRQRAENVATAAELRLALAAANELQVTLAEKIGRVDAIKNDQMAQPMSWWSSATIL